MTGLLQAGGERFPAACFMVGPEAGLQERKEKFG